MRGPILGFAIAIGGLSFVALNAQHGQPQHPGAAHVGTHAAASHRIPFEHLCGSDDVSAKHAAAVASALELTTDQSARFEKVTSEACAAMTKYHERILSILTPEQRETLKELHGRH